MTSVMLCRHFMNNLEEDGMNYWVMGIAAFIIVDTIILASAYIHNKSH